MLMLFSAVIFSRRAILCAPAFDGYCSEGVATQKRIKVAGSFQSISKRSGSIFELVSGWWDSPQWPLKGAVDRDAQRLFRISSGGSLFSTPKHPQR